MVPLYTQKPDEEFLPLDGAQLHAFKKAMRNIKFVVIDEFSMVGCELMHKIDQRLRQGKDNPNEEFGGVFLYMFGDINQLPPPFDCPVFSNNQESMETFSGKMLYDDIESAFILDNIHRQTDQRFQELLNNISTGNISKEDYDILAKRFTTEVTAEERKKFQDAPHFYPTNKQKDDYNFKTLSELKDPLTNLLRPVARIPAKISKKGLRAFSCEDEGLEPVLYLSKGSRIMLKSNLWTEKGLVNGSVGKIVDIVYHPDASPQEDPPAVLICQFDCYRGPYLDPEKKTIPIAPVQKSSSPDGEK